MGIDLKILGEKLGRYRNQFQLSQSDVAQGSGISVENIERYESGTKRPTGDEILILAEFYKCDYKFFLSNQQLAPFEQTETLFRKFGDELSKQDRWSIQECLFLAECESYVMSMLHRNEEENFHFRKQGSYFKAHGAEAADALRRHLGYKDNEVSMNIYEDMRRVGVKVSRRKLENSKISGICIRHPVAGYCALINYSEDVYRQRFTAAHELAHTILDNEEDVIVSFQWDRNDLVEMRANTFASAYLMPPQFLTRIPDVQNWSSSKAVRWANNFKVSTQALAIALSASNLIDDAAHKTIVETKVPNSRKIDPELPVEMSSRATQRKRALLMHGLSDHYVSLCFDAYRNDLVSANRLVEMLLIESDSDLLDIAKLYGEKIRYDS